MDFLNFNNSILTQPIPTMVKSVDTPIQHMWADDQFKHLKRYIQKFEAELDSDHEVAIMLTNFGQSIIMQVEYITYETPVLMIFKGNVNGRPATLIQHVNQLNFMLTSVEKEVGKEKHPIGFHTSDSNEYRE